MAIKKPITNNFFTTLGSTAHALWEREQNDFYATDPIAIKLLLEQEKFKNTILEPACWQWHLSKPLIEAWYEVESYDLVDRWYWKVKNFFDITEWNWDIITNPPYAIAQKFVEHSLDIIKPWAKAALFLKVLFLESRTRKKLFLENPPKVIYVCSGRVNCVKNWDFDRYSSTALAHAWFVWEKWYKGDTIVKWIN